MAIARGDGRARYCRRSERAEIKRDPNQDDSRASASFDGNVALDPSTITAIKIRVNNPKRTSERELGLFVNPWPSERRVQK